MTARKPGKGRRRRRKKKVSSSPLTRGTIGIPVSGAGFST